MKMISKVISLSLEQTMALRALKYNERYIVCAEFERYFHDAQGDDRKLLNSNQWKTNIRRFRGLDRQGPYKEDCTIAKIEIIEAFKKTFNISDIKRFLANGDGKTPLPLKLDQTDEITNAKGLSTEKKTIDDRSDEEAAKRNDYVEQIETRISDLIAKSSALTNWLITDLELPSAISSIQDRSADLAHRLTSDLKLEKALESLRRAYKFFTTSDPVTKKIIHRVTLDLLLLIFEEDQIAPLRNNRPDAGGIFFQLRAARETAAEIAMAAAGSRPAAFRKGEYKWPLGLNALPKLPVTGPSDNFDAIVKDYIIRFEAHVMSLVLGDDELAEFTPEQKLRHTNRRLKSERELKGVFYLAFRLPQARIERSVLEKIINEHLGPRWPSIVFLQLSEDEELLDREEDLLFGLSQILVDEAGSTH